MKVLDNCHTYLLDFFLGTGEGYFKAIGSEIHAYPKIHFYEIREDGQKIDGVTNEEVLRVLIHRLEALNEKFSCAENRLAIDHLVLALGYLNARTRDRVGRGVEGKMEP